MNDDPFGYDCFTIFETANSIYEVRESEKRFRRVHETHAPSEALPLGQWFRYQRMSPVTTGEPVRFFWILGESGAVSRIGLWATGPVVAVLPEEDESYLLPAHG